MTRILTQRRKKPSSVQAGRARPEVNPHRSSLDADVTHDSLTPPRFLGRLGNLFTGKERTF